MLALVFGKVIRSHHYHNSSLVLYIIYYPPRLKYQYTVPDSFGAEDTLYDHDTRPLLVGNSKPMITKDWCLSITLTWVIVAHLCVFFFLSRSVADKIGSLFIFTTTFYLLTSIPTPPSSNPSVPLPPAISSWATFLGVSSALLSAVQYAPQLVHTYRTKLVGALSIPTMCIQSPGSAIMVLSIALRLVHVMFIL